MGIISRERYIVKEFYYSGRDASIQKSDVQYSKELKKFLGDIIPIKIIVDPSATSFITQLRDDGFKNILKAKNDGSVYEKGKGVNKTTADPYKRGEKVF